MCYKFTRNRIVALGKDNNEYNQRISRLQKNANERENVKKNSVLLSRSGLLGLSCVNK